MWREPWQNGLTTATSSPRILATSAAADRQAGPGHLAAAAAGMTDLILATTGEQLGLLSILFYLALLGAIAGTGFAIAARNRTPERMLAASGLAILLLAQWAIIHAGTTGALPLTGVVVPLLSSGRSSMVAFLLVIGLLARLAEDARPQAPSEELIEMRASVLAVAAIGLVALIIGLGTAGHRAVIDREEVAARGIVRRLADGCWRTGRTCACCHRQPSAAARSRIATPPDRDQPRPGHPAAQHPLGADQHAARVPRSAARQLAPSGGSTTTCAAMERTPGMSTGADKTDGPKPTAAVPPLLDLTATSARRTPLTPTPPPARLPTLDVRLQQQVAASLRRPPPARPATRRRRSSSTSTPPRCPRAGPDLDPPT
jgi:hypothetical protein